MKKLLSGLHGALLTPASGAAANPEVLQLLQETLDAYSGEPEELLKTIAIKQGVPWATTPDKKPNRLQTALGTGQQANASIATLQDRLAAREQLIKNAGGADKLDNWVKDHATEYRELIDRAGPLSRGSVLSETSIIEGLKPPEKQEATVSMNGKLELIPGPNGSLIGQLLQTSGKIAGMPAVGGGLV
jgi:hypothetical protein